MEQPVSIPFSNFYHTVFLLSTVNRPAVFNQHNFGLSPCCDFVCYTTKLMF